MSTLDEYRSRLNKAVVTIKDLSAKLAGAQKKLDEPIAVVGLACRFPGASDPASFFQALTGGVDCVRRIPKERWRSRAISMDRPELRFAGLLDDVDAFDAVFFGISPREAVQLDPQQRLLLEVVFEALESAGQNVDRLMGSQTGAFIGMTSCDYQFIVREAGAQDLYTSTGNMHSTAAGRISYVLGLQGPSVAIDTACSSSLTAVHFACESLRRGESDLALAGGVHLILDATIMAMVAETQALSPDGRCRTFDARANGIARGEGAGIVVLKRLSDAKRDGDRILAVIRGSAVNQDGRSAGMTAPNVLSQEALLRQALENAHLSAEDIGYVETHGTGTSLGDPIEFEALRSVLGAPRADGSRCVLGALKTNMGHMEAVAGVGGLIKAILCLEGEVIPKNLHFRSLNPRISLEGTPFLIPTENVPWESGGKPRRAGVSAFGLSGTNVHVILEEAPRRENAAADVPSQSSVLLPLSAKSPQALLALSKSYSEWLTAAKSESASLSDLAYTAGVRRCHHANRLAVVGSSKEALSEALAAYARGEAPPGLVSGEAPVTAPKVVFVFPGQGLLWGGMGRSLLEEEPVFREAFEACDAAIQREAGFSVLAEIRADEGRSRLAEIDVAQPVLFAIEVALAALWRARGVRPDVVVGHSMGEVAAAHVAGALSLDEAAQVICRRSGLLRRVSGKGAMAMVELSMADAERALSGYADRLSVAASNGPRSTVIAGEPSALQEVLDKLLGEGVFCQRVKVTVASHSPQTEPLTVELRAALAGLAPKATQVSMQSTVTGERVSGEELRGDYWANNLRKPVLFAPVVEQLIDAGHTLFIEMSPHPSLLPSVDEALGQRKVVGAAVSSLRFRVDDRRSLLESLGKLYAQGYPVDFSRLYSQRGRVADLPTYPWQKERFWVETSAATASRSVRVAGGIESEHPLLGVLLLSSVHTNEQTWEQVLSAESTPYLRDHKVQGEIVFPGAGYVEMALAAGKEKLGAAELVVEGITFDQMLALADKAERIAQVVLTDEGAGRFTFQIASRGIAERSFVKHARGRVCLLSGQPADAGAEERPEALKARLTGARSAAEHYQQARERHVDFGPSFQGLLEMWTGDEAALGRVRLPDDVEDSGYLLHPALLDACLQVAGGLSIVEKTTETYVPIRIDHISLWARPPRGAWVVAKRRVDEAMAEGEHAFDVRIVNEEGRPWVEVQGLRLRRLLATVAAAEDPLAGCVHDVVWRRVEPLAEAVLPEGGAWLLLMDKSGVGASLKERLSAKGQRCVCVVAGTSYGRIKEDLYEIALDEPEDYRRLLREAFGDDGRCQGAAHLLSMDAAPLDATTLETLSADLLRGSVSATYLAQALVRHGFRDLPRLSLITRGAQPVLEGEPVSVGQAPLLGLGRTIAMEHPELRCTRIDLDVAVGEDDAERLSRELSAKDREDQIALRGADRHVARVVRGSFEPREDAASKDRLEPARGRPFQLLIPKPGVLAQLALHEIRELSPGPLEVLVEVEAAALNFRDVLLALGAVPDDAPGADGRGPRLGGECAGKIVAVGEGVTAWSVGQEVIAVGARALGSFMLARSCDVARKPARLSWDEAAALPLVFMTAYYALNHVARLRRGERVLIHAGAGGVGLAAIQWAKHVGAEIFATAGSDEKRAYLRSLGVPHVLDSRSLAFAEEIKRITKGEGIDVVLNSLSGEFIPASLSLLRSRGRFVEIGLRDYYEDKQLGLRPFLRSLSLSLVDLRGLMLEQPEAWAAMLNELLQMFEEGTLTPLPVRVFPASQAVEAFRFMAQAKHIGKIAIAMKDADARIVPLNERKGFELREDRSYLITGGLTGLGLSLASWLVDQGVRHLALAGRRSPSEEAERAIAAMRQAGADVLVVSADVSRRADVEMMFSRIDERLPKLAGIVHAAMVLEDHTLLEQSEEGFRKVFAPKGLGAWNLHSLSEGRELDFFVMYSSAASLFGAPGQANYTASNAFLDALSHERERRGLRSMSIQWGGFAEIGQAAAFDNRGKRLSNRGGGSFTPAEGLLALRRLLAHPRAEVGVVRFNARQWIEFYPGTARIPFFSEIMAEKSSAAGDAIAARRMVSSLESAAPLERASLLERHLLQELGAVLRLDPSRMDRAAPFQSMGMDSLMSLELRNRLEVSLGIRLSATILFTYPAAQALAEHLLARLGMTSQAGGQEVEQAPAPEVSDAAHVDMERALDELSDDELMSRLAAKLGGRAGIDENEENAS